MGIFKGINVVILLYLGAEFVTLMMLHLSGSSKHVLSIERTCYDTELCKYSIPIIFALMASKSRNSYDKIFYNYNSLKLERLVVGFTIINLMLNL
ncbi:hypothetical protein ACI65C_013671 [Semiaphis heraclei]